MEQHLDKIIETVFSKDGLYISIIIGILILIKDVIKAKVKNGIEWFLDYIGRVTKGRFARQRFTKLYLRHIVFSHKYLQLIGFNTAGIRRPLLEEVFVSLRVSNFETTVNPLIDLKDDHNDKSISFANAIERFPKLVILGAPGAGKTTILKYALLTFATQKGYGKFQISKELLPIFVPLRRLSSNNDSIIDDIENFETQILPKELLKDCPDGFFEKMLKNGNCIVLLDGLDEVVDEDTHQRVSQKIDNLTLMYPHNLYIVTCRVAGWKGLLNDFVILETKDFNKQEINDFIKSWNKAVITKSERDKIEAETSNKEEFRVEWNKHENRYVKPAIKKMSINLLNAIGNNDRIFLIATNPMLLSLICLVHYNRATLPKGRTELYEQCIGLLIDDWDRKRNIISHSEVSSDEKERILQEIAYDFQKKGIGETTRDNLKETVLKFINKDPKEIDNLIDDIEKRSGILVERSIDVLGFSHLTLQEYLVAKHIHLYFEEKYKVILENTDKQEWREVILLFSGLIGDSSNLVRSIIGNLNDITKISVSRLLLAAWCIGDSQKCDEKIIKVVSNELIKRLEDDKGQKEAIIHALSFIAADYDKDALLSKELISKELIEKIQNF